MVRRQFLKLLGLLPFAPLAAMIPTRMAMFSNHPVVLPNLRTYGATMEIPELAVPALNRWTKTQRRREQAWFAELFRATGCRVR